MNKIKGIVLFLLFSGNAFGQAPKLKVRIDLRVESVSIFYILAVTDSINDKPTPSIYYKDVKDYFKDFAQNPSIMWYRNLDAWDGYDVSSTGFFLSPKQPYKMADTLARKYIRSSDPKTFLKKLNEFCKDYDIKKFIRRHRSLYSEVTSSVYDSIRADSILAYTQKFYKTNDVKEVYILLDLLNNIGNNAIPLNEPKYKGVCLLRLSYLSDDKNNLTDNSPVRFHVFQNVLAHEASHIYLKGFIPLYENKLDKIKSLFLTTSDGTKINSSQWKNELDELLVRTCVAEILKSKFGKKAGENEVNDQAERYKWIKPLYQFINDNYLDHQYKYKNFKTFYPELLAYFEQLYRKENT